jgi:putative SOS response-associated peptidase YedK
MPASSICEGDLTRHRDPDYILGMCGRARLSSDVSQIKIAFGIRPERPTPNIAPRWNLAPTDPAPVVYYDAKHGGRRLEVMRWGLIPYWAKDIKIGFSTINARADEVDTKPAFREAFQRRRCLVPLDSFYEWVRRESRVCDCPAMPSGRTCRPIGSTLRGRADRKRAV